jgi:hypothetical protein
MSKMIVMHSSELDDIVAIHIGKKIFHAKLQPGQEPSIISNGLSVKLRDVECDGPIMPHKYHTKSGLEMMVKRPQLKVCFKPDTMGFDIAEKLDLMSKAAFVFQETKIATAFQDFFTFTYKEVFTDSLLGQNERAYSVMVVTKRSEVVPLQHFIANADRTKLNAIGPCFAGKGITFKDTKLSEEGALAKDVVFEKFKSTVHAKTGRLYLDMNLVHKDFPTINGQVVRKYLNNETGDKANPYHEAMADPSQWGIEIPILSKTAAGGYAMIKGSNWIKDPLFHAVTKFGDRNNFIGTITFNPEVVMSGSGNLKTWWRVVVCKQPEESSFSRGYDYGEEIVEPTTEAMAIMPPSRIVTGKTTVMEDEDEYEGGDY